MAGELISREALDRIIQRAAELQTGERDIGEGLTEAELVALGNDVGIPARYLKQALLEERTRLPEERRERGLAWSLVGPGRLDAHRVVPGDRAGIERALSAWMENEELLRVKRRYPDRITWEPQVGFIASMQRGLRAGGRSYALTRAVEVAGQVTQLEPGFCHVRLSADVRNLRRARIGGAAVLAGTGAAGSVVAATLGVLFPFVALPAIGLGVLALTTLVAGRGAQLGRIEVGLEQVLDRLERGEIRAEHALPGPRASAFVRIADEIRKQFQI
jgi:hypothetical protein